jgi:hypothetical protein
MNRDVVKEKLLKKAAVSKMKQEKKDKASNALGDPWEEDSPFLPLEVIEENVALTRSELEPHMFDFKGWLQEQRNGYEVMYARIKSMSLSTLVELQDRYERWSYGPVFPRSFYLHPKMIRFVMWYMNFPIEWMNMFYVVHSCMLYGLLYKITSAIMFSLVVANIGAMIIHYTLTYTIELMVREELTQRTNVLDENIRRYKIREALISVTLLAILYKIARATVWKPNEPKWNKADFGDKRRGEDDDSLDEQGNLDPKSDADIAERDAEDNPWLNVESVPFPRTLEAGTATSDQVIESMKTNLVGVKADRYGMLGFFICSNVMILPKHFLDAHNTNDIEVKINRSTKKGCVGQEFRDKISKNFSYHIPGTDFALCWVTNGGAFKDFRKFLPLSKEIPMTPAKFVTRDVLDPELKVDKTLTSRSRLIGHTLAKFYGCTYQLSFKTQKGMCMSPVISDQKGASIIGFHLGGKEFLGGCGILTLEQVEDGINKLQEIDGILLSASSKRYNFHPNMGTFTNYTFGQKIVKDKEIHYKSATKFLPEGSNIEVFGATNDMATPRSSVKDTLISDIVTKVTGFENKWGPPQMTGPGKYPYQASLLHSANPSMPIGSLMEKAVKDYKSVIPEVKKRSPKLFKCKPLDKIEVVSGIPGCKFIDKMNFNTSPGYPFKGSKHKFLVPVYDPIYGHYAQPMTFVQSIWDEVDECERQLREGERCFAIWKACLKDEPTKKTKDKVRVFQSAPLPIQIMVRKYFLPIVRIIQMNPLAFECAVGVNAESPEWMQLWSWAISKGIDRILAGDHSKYDLRMAAQSTSAAFDCIIEIARHCEGYEEEDIELMKLMATEIIYPLINYNGDLIQLFGGNPSGQNLTVILNSVVNSLLLRACFFSIYPDKNFRDYCAFITYGDDVMGSVAAECDKFNHLTFAEFLERHDMKFTMPDKEAKATKYMHESECDFLKRSNRYNPDLGCSTGVLSEESIFKRLHSVKASKELSDEMHSATNIDSSIRDWFYYGREHYEKRRKQMQEIAKEAGISHLCLNLDKTYDDFVHIWHQKYDKTAQKIEDKPDESFELVPHFASMKRKRCEFEEESISAELMSVDDMEWELNDVNSVDSMSVSDLDWDEFAHWNYYSPLDDSDQGVYIYTMDYQLYDRLSHEAELTLFESWLSSAP